MIALLDDTDAVRLDPKYANAYQNRGIAYAQKGDHDKANMDFDYAKKLGM